MADEPMLPSEDMGRAMIPATAHLSAAWLPLSHLVVEQCEERDLARVQFYVDLMREYPGEHAGPPIAVRPRGNGTYAVQDGHHRFLAHLLLGKRLAPYVIVDEPVS